jgi:hypothetical protein
VNARHLKSGSEADPKEIALNRVGDALKHAKVDGVKSAEIMGLLHSPFFWPSGDADSENWIKVYRHSWAEAETDVVDAIWNKPDVVDIVIRFKPTMNVALEALMREKGEAAAIALNNVVACTLQAMSIITNDAAKITGCSRDSMAAVSYIVAFGVSCLLVPTIEFEGKKELFDCIVGACLPAVKAGLVPRYYDMWTHAIYVCGLQSKDADILRDQE